MMPVYSLRRTRQEDSTGEDRIPFIEYEEAPISPQAHCGLIRNQGGVQLLQRRMRIVGWLQFRLTGHLCGLRWPDAAPVTAGPISLRGYRMGDRQDPGGPAHNPTPGALPSSYQILWHERSPRPHHRHVPQDGPAFAAGRQAGPSGRAYWSSM
jgi:hypothetical protein